MVQPTRRELIEAVKKHARQHYEYDGWDVVIEAMTDKEIDEAIGRARSVSGAIANVGVSVGAYHSYRQDIQGTVF